MHRTIAVNSAVSLLAADAHMRPGTIVSPQLDSGVTSSNGDGARAVGNQPGVGVTTRVGLVR